HPRNAAVYDYVDIVAGHSEVDAAITSLGHVDAHDITLGIDHRAAGIALLHFAGQDHLLEHPGLRVAVQTVHRSYKDGDGSADLFAEGETAHIDCLSRRQPRGRFYLQRRRQTRRINLQYRQIGRLIHSQDLRLEVLLLGRTAVQGHGDAFRLGRTRRDHVYHVRVGEHDSWLKGKKTAAGGCE